MNAYVLYVVAHDPMRDEYLVIEQVGWDGPVTVVGHFTDRADAEALRDRLTALEELAA